MHSLLRLAKLDWPLPDFGTVCRRQKILQVELSYWPPQTSLSKASAPMGSTTHEAAWTSSRSGKRWR